DCLLWLYQPIFVFFFFQAEDGRRDFHVTGVQTCALPIWIRKVRPSLSRVVSSDSTGKSVPVAIASALRASTVCMNGVVMSFPPGRVGYAIHLTRGASKRRGNHFC